MHGDLLVSETGKSNETAIVGWVRCGCATFKKEESAMEYRALGGEKIDLDDPESLNKPGRWW